MTETNGTYTLAGLPESLSYAVGRLAIKPSLPPQAVVAALDVLADILAPEVDRAQLWRALREVTIDSTIFTEHQGEAIGKLLNAADLSGEVRQLYRKPSDALFRTGWPSLDAFYRVRLGELTTTTGVPNHGKSSFIDALTLNMMRIHDWKIGVYSAENLPPERHFARFIEKWIGKRFWPGPSPRVSEEQITAAIEWFSEHLVFLRPPQEPPTVPQLLALAAEAARTGTRGFVIDPWNELSHERPAWQSETEYISGALGQIRRFAQDFKVHVWLVAHPAKLFRQRDGHLPIPGPYDIAGSAHFRNKSDNCLCVHRMERPGEHTDETTIHVQKIRFWEVGRLGAVRLHYNHATGGFDDPLAGAGGPTA